MQKQRATKTIVCGCLLVGLFVGVAAAQVAEAIFRVQFLNTSLFSVTANQVAAFHVTVDDEQGGPPARVALRVFNPAGTQVAGRDVVLSAGQSTTMPIPGPGLFRVHAQIAESSDLDFTARRRVHGSVEVHDRLTGVIRPTCSFDPVGLPPGR